MLGEFLERVEKELIVRAMRRAKNNKSKAARLLGLTRPRLYRRLIQLGLEPPGDAAAAIVGSKRGRLSPQAPLRRMERPCP